MMVSSLLLRPFPSASFKEEPFTRSAGFTSKILLNSRIQFRNIERFEILFGLQKVQKNWKLGSNDHKGSKVQGIKKVQNESKFQKVQQFKMIQGSTKTRTRSISEKRGNSRPSMKVTKPQAPASPAKNNGKSKGSSKSTGSAGSGKDLLSSNLDVFNTIYYISCVLKLYLCIYKNWLVPKWPFCGFSMIEKRPKSSNIILVERGWIWKH